MTDGLPLEGFTVVDLSSGIPGGYCTKLLVDGGADVVKVESPHGDELRRWSASGTVIPADDDGALFQFLACSKQSVVADPACAEGLAFARDLVRAADAVVWSPGSAVADHDALSPAALRQLAPHAIVTAITPFGLEGPWSDRAATDFTLQAWSGGISPRGRPDRAPVAVGGRPVEWVAGLCAALSTLASRLRWLETGRGELLDVSMLESAALSLTSYPVTIFEGLGRPWRIERALNIPGVEETKDGWVGLMCGTGQHWLDFCVMVDRPEWTEDESLFSVQTRSDRAAELVPRIREWTLARTTDEIRELATAFRIPNAPVGTGATLPQLDHIVARGSYLPNPRGGFIQPAPPFRLHGLTPRAVGAAPRLGEQTDVHRARVRAPRAAPAAAAVAAALPLSGLRVLDMTGFIAGPICTHVLAMLGAEVIHVESITRPDGFRFFSAKPLTDDGWWDLVPAFYGGNTNKKDLTLDLQSEQGRELALRMIASCDAVVENYSTRVMENVGLGYEEVRKARPDVIMVRMPGYGLDGPWRDLPAMAPTIEDASGMTWLTGYPDDTPQEPYSVCDPGAGFHAAVAFLLALSHRRKTGEGMLVEAPMIGGALNFAAEQVIEYSAYGNLLERMGNRGPAAAPQNLYLTADTNEFGRSDCWVAIAIATNEQWLALRKALGDPGWASDSQLLTAAGRRVAHDEIDDALAAWCAKRSAAEIVETLWPAGVPIGKVMLGHRQTELEQLQARGFFETVDHPVAGPIRHSTFPVRFSGGPHAFLHRHAPLLGEHNIELLSELGVSDAEIAQLEADGIVGTRVRMG
ncbi:MULTISPECIES: CoA transferase [unclassified Mycobacterium]|uniref:CaiB/BaiF CoA transferase family protein n=1 Tax=unclassified Mycobacterium TaxID=2642494 RepID=UPI0029C61C77|nr:MULTISPECIES: CoA transferase [unclassified Mycobacterium]